MKRRSIILIVTSIVRKISRKYVMNHGVKAKGNLFGNLSRSSCTSHLAKPRLQSPALYCNMLGSNCCWRIMRSLNAKIHDADLAMGAWDGKMEQMPASAYWLEQDKAEGLTWEGWI